MARPPRDDFEGAIHHVYGRGNDRQVLFRDEADYRAFLLRARDLKDELDIHLLAYCPMPNHYHFVARTGRHPLETFMHRLLSSYSRYFNDRWQHVGHVFQGRYASPRLKTNASVRRAIRYVHLNPVEAGLCQAPEGWPWSGHNGMVARADLLLDVEEALGVFDDGGCPVVQYRAFLEEAPAHRRPLLEIAADACTPEEVLLLRGRTQVRAAVRLRREFIAAARREGHRNSEIARFLGRSCGSITYMTLRTLK